MAKMQRSGLHKEISTIFNGVPMPAGSGKQDSVGSSAADPAGGNNDPVSNIAASGTTQKESVKPAAKPQPQRPTIQMPSAPKQSSFGGLNKFFEQVSAKLFAPKPGVSPAKQKLTVALMPVLFIVAVFVLGRNFVGTGNSNKGKSQKNILGPSSASAKKEIDWQRPAPYPQTLRDPMKKHSVTATVSNAPVKDDIVIKGIVFSKDNPSVIIGAQILHTGEVIEGAKIVKISKDSVEFERDGETWSQKVDGY